MSVPQRSELSQSVRAPDILDSIRGRIEALRLDLSGRVVITEAATGTYACTAVIAALAGAERVHCVSRDTAHYGGFDDAVAATMTLAAQAGVADRIDIARSIDPDVLASCDILTNSGHLRPITAGTIARLPRTAVIALMFEAWEFRETDLDLDACRERGIRVAAVNERHPDVGVFPFLGPLCVRQLTDAGLDPAGRRVALLCDNPFAAFLLAGLREAGAGVSLFDAANKVPAADWDAVVVALDPGRNQVLGNTEIVELSQKAPDALLTQFWGDIEGTSRCLWPGKIWPVWEPGRGHMGILLNALGHEPIVRLQTGGLRAAEQIWRGCGTRPDGIAQQL